MEVLDRAPAVRRTDAPWFRAAGPRPRRREAFIPIHVSMGSVFCFSSQAPLDDNPVRFSADHERDIVAVQD
ncbi:hypothetical protein [Paraburkholderia aromaticivorans]|uniref:hypothetical protein n=1 Tax=Paraburkholderia aromaticivorans TaxID=2026199 RepID=UPI001455E4D4|nr:hypothetical protein [Paraburkholderia aromaticivorans]